MILRWGTLSIAALAIAISVLAQRSPREPVWKVVDVWRQPQGIPLNAVIRTIVQTRDGYMWVGVKAGLARFDGVNFTLFDARDPRQLRDDEVRSLTEDAQGALWIGTYGGGVSVLKDGQFTVYTTAEGLPNDFINALAVDGSGTVWIGSDDGLASFRDGRFRNYTASDGSAPFASATTLHVDTSGDLWIGTLKGEVYRHASGQFERIPTSPVLPPTVVYALARERNGVLWIGTLEGLYRLDGTLRRVGPAEGFAGTQVRALHRDDSDNLWIGSNVGLLRHHGGRFQRCELGFQEDSPNYVYAVCVDREGSVWAGAGGLLRLQPSAFTHFTERGGLSYNRVSTLAPAGAAGLWVGTTRGLDLLLDGKFSSVPDSAGLPTAAVSAIATDQRGRLWVGTDEGTFRSAQRVDLPEGVPAVDFRTPLPREVQSLYPRGLLVDRTGHVWIAANREGVFRVDPDDRVIRFTKQDGLPDEAARGLAEDRAGNIWIGTRAGLVRYRAGTFTAFTTRHGLIDSPIENIFLDGNDVVWVSTRRGVGRFENERFTNFTVNQGLHANFIIGMAQDGAGNLWMNGSKGVFCVALDELAAVAAGRQRRVRAVVYGREHGLDSPVIASAGRCSVLTTQDGRMWFGMSHGLFALDPDSLVFNDRPPPVHIEGATIDHQPFDPRHAALAPPGRGDLEFRFTALSFIAPEKVRFKYRLDGYDRDWIDAANRRSTSYSNIPPGDYTFRVIASNNDGIWNEAGANFAFKLKPHFHQTYVFYGLCGALVVGAGASWHWVRTRRLRERQNQLMSMVDDRTRDLQARTVELQEEVSEHARTEAELRHYKEHLEEQVAARTKAWRESREMLQSVIDSVPALIHMTDAEGRVLFVNRLYAERLRSTSDAMIGRPLADFLPSEDPGAPRHPDRIVVSAAGPVEAEEAVTLPDGSVRTFLSIRRALRNQDGQPYAICGIATDITHVKQIEEQLRQSQKMEAIGRLAGGIAHDFNNLLTAINGYSSLALYQLQPAHELYEPLHEIAKAGEKAAALTRQLLAYSRKQMLVPKPWNLNSIMGDMESLLKRIVGEDVHLSTILRREVGVALVDRGQVEQIVLNLSINARDAMPEGGRLTLETGRVVFTRADAAAQLEIKPGPYVMLVVSDTGHGMSDMVKARLFEPFFTTKELGKGTGLGLSVVYGIVQQSGGSIKVESEPGRGTTFRIYFPEIRDPAVVQGAQPSAPLRRSGGTETVLLVEDEELVRNFISNALEADGYSVVSASNGREALRRIAEGAQVDLVITDAVMPDMGGKEMSEELARTSPGLPVLFMSGYTENTLFGRERSAEHFLQKPFTHYELLEKIRVVLDRSHAAASVRARSAR